MVRIQCTILYFSMYVLRYERLHYNNVALLVEVRWLVGVTSWLEWNTLELHTAQLLSQF